MKKQNNWPRDFLITTTKKGTDVHEYYKGKQVQLIADGLTDFNDAKPIMVQWCTTLEPEVYMESFETMLDERLTAITEADIEENEVRVFSTMFRDQFNGQTPNRDLYDIESQLKKVGFKKMNMLKQSNKKEIKSSYANNSKFVCIVRSDSCWLLHVRSL